MPATRTRPDADIETLRRWRWPGEDDPEFLERLPEPAYDPGDLEGAAVAVDGELTERIRDAIEAHPAHLATNTRLAYRQHLGRYLALCRHFGWESTSLIALRDHVYALAYPRLRYLHALRHQRRRGGAERKPRGQEPGYGIASLRQVIAAIGLWQTAADWEPPSACLAWERWLQGLAVALRQAVDQKDALLLDDLERMLACIADTAASTTQARRDRCLLLLWWWGALRISELTGLCVEDLRCVDSGWVIVLEDSKTNRGGPAILKPLYPMPDSPQLDPIAAYQAWREHSGIAMGPIFRGLTAKHTLRRTGMTANAARGIIQRWYDLSFDGDPATKRKISGHSPRIGYVTEHARHGIALQNIMAVTGHSDPRMPLHYINDADPHARGPGPLRRHD